MIRKHYLLLLYLAIIGLLGIFPPWTFAEWGWNIPFSHLSNQDVQVIRHSFIFNTHHFNHKTIDWIVYYPIRINFFVLFCELVGISSLFYFISSFSGASKEKPNNIKAHSGLARMVASHTPISRIWAFIVFILSIFPPWQFRLQHLEFTLATQLKGLPFECTRFSFLFTRKEHYVAVTDMVFGYSSVGVNFPMYACLLLIATVFTILVAVFRYLHNSSSPKVA